VVKRRIIRPSEGRVPSSNLGETISQQRDVRPRWPSSALIRRQTRVRLPHARLCRRSSAGEQGSYKAQVGGSIPSAGINIKLEWRNSGDARGSDPRGRKTVPVRLRPRARRSGGGTGRHAGLRCLCPKGRASSTLALSMASPEWWNGRHAWLKPRCSGVPVRLRPRANQRKRKEARS
jgi:hypothetical protein